jgi:hypothetical protein
MVSSYSLHRVDTQACSDSELIPLINLDIHQDLDRRLLLCKISAYTGEQKRNRKI